MKKIIQVTGLVLALVGLVAMEAQAESTGLRQIMGMGCHNVDGSCYVTVDGAAVGSSYGCGSTSIRWNAEHDPGGARWFSLLEGAFLSGKRVVFEVRGCYADQPSFPTFIYGTVAK